MFKHTMWIWIGVSCIASQVFAKDIILKVVASPEAVSVTYRINAILHWSDGKTTNESLDESDIQAGSRKIPVADGGTAIIGCESQFVPAPDAFDSTTLFPHDQEELHELVTRHVPCVPDGASAFDLVPQFSARSLVVEVDPSIFDSTQAFVVLVDLNAVGSSQYTTPGPQVNPSSKPQTFNFRIISTMDIAVATHVLWVAHGGKTGKLQFVEEPYGKILIH